MWHRFNKLKYKYQGNNYRGTLLEETKLGTLINIQGFVRCTQNLLFPLALFSLGLNCILFITAMWLGGGGKYCDIFVVV